MAQVMFHKHLNIPKYHHIDLLPGDEPHLSCNVCLLLLRIFITRMLDAVNTNECSHH